MFLHIVPKDELGQIWPKSIPLAPCCALYSVYMCYVADAGQAMAGAWLQEKEEGGNRLHHTEGPWSNNWCGFLLSDI